MTLAEVEQLILAAECRGHHSVRDKALLLLMFRHGLRVSEAITLKWDAVMLEEKAIGITRLKGSVSGSHPLQADEIEALEDLRAEDYPGLHLFASERSGHLSRHAVTNIINQCGELAELGIKCHPHMLRHACGYHLANQGLDTRLIQDWLGHKNIQHTVAYTVLNAKRFGDISWSV
ncbi:tyrosine recombinase (plasmid) [Acaryochloris marina MBIC10699]|nr:tyrosine recombinase [Acaryochloris marina MBIC10699]